MAGASYAAQPMAMENIQRQPVPIGKVFIQRDYSDGMKVKFQTKLPLEINDRIDQRMFETTVIRLNEIYGDAEALKARIFCEGCLICLTGYLALLCVKSHYERKVKEAARYIQSQNDEVYAPRGLVLVDPFERGLRVIEIVILPQDRG
ncbi:golgin subfamily A member 7-like isoform X2 [Patiria miniata]|uniref:Ras modification protein ERF4 n=1 Tax=Patiria miniata TaxID=46514 RepID=A0A913Z4J3_PATMI|nr:golgin subfamily A member 7-like isoform X2 [Patiria miniata]